MTESTRGERPPRDRRAVELASTQGSPIALPVPQTPAVEATLEAGALTTDPECLGQGCCSVCWGKSGLGGAVDSGSLPSKKSQKWDEMNILATYHPADKDYGLMKIDEPSTPYHSMIGDNDDDILSDSEANETLPPEVLARKLSAAEGSEPKFLIHDDESSEEEDDLTPEEREKRRQFEMKRKLHYNEGLNIKLARQLISKELRGDEEDEDEDDKMRPGGSSACQSQSDVP